MHQWAYVKFCTIIPINQENSGCYSMIFLYMPMGVGKEPVSIQKVQFYGHYN